MCGIAGGFWFDRPNNLEKKFDNAIYALRRRGPNDQGLEFFGVLGGVVAQAHTRLSVIDLTNAGHQPMRSTDGRYSIVFNGEIYNYRELRKLLVSYGYNFRTDSDTEVLIYAWAHWGKGCLDKLVGMFAFVIFDKKKKKLTCARDPFGIKPFFYTLEEGNFLFASEISAIKCLKQKKLELDWQRSYDYLVHADYDSGSNSFIKDVQHLMPGHLMEFDIATKHLSNPLKFWNPDVSQKSNLTFDQAAEELRDKFLSSIKLHMRSDVAIGAALSGGVDSSSVVCAMRYVEPDIPINTFSYIAKDSKLSEESWVDLVNEFAKATPHKVYVTSEELCRDLDDLILSQGEPFGSTSIYAQYRVFKLAKDHNVTVTLDGQGADELLAGYQGYPGKRVRSLLDEGRFLDAARFLVQWSSWPDRSFSKGLKQTFAEFFDGEIYNLLRGLHGDTLYPSWVNSEMLNEVGVIGDYPKRNGFKMPKRRLISELAYSVTNRGLPSLLRHGDRNSMRFSVESRVPFLTSDIADYLFSLPEHYLISKQGETKKIFREAMRGIVPDAILDRRDKIGFATPEKDLLIAMSDQIRLWLSEDINLPILNQKFILNEFDLIISGKKSFSSQAWRWINFIRWYQLFFLS